MSMGQRFLIFGIMIGGILLIQKLNEFGTSGWIVFGVVVLCIIAIAAFILKRINDRSKQKQIEDYSARKASQARKEGNRLAEKYWRSVTKLADPEHHEVKHLLKIGAKIVGDQEPTDDDLDRCEEILNSWQELITYEKEQSNLSIIQDLHHNALKPVLDKIASKLRAREAMHMQKRKRMMDEVQSQEQKRYTRESAAKLARNISSETYPPWQCI